MELLSVMKGRWSAFFAETCQELNIARHAGYSHVACSLPGHAHSADGFRLFRDFDITGGAVCNTCGNFSNGIKLYAAQKAISFAQATVVIQEWAALPENKVAFAVNYQAKDPDEIRIVRELAIKTMLAQALPSVEGSPVWLYLTGRGLHLDAEVLAGLFYHPMQDYWGRPPGGKQLTLYGRFPVMLAPILDISGQVVSIHRTYLTLDGKKATVDPVRKLLPAAGKLSGAAIHLLTRPEHPELHVTEGIETCLAVHNIVQTGSFWAAGNASLLESLVVPAWITVLHVWADLDVQHKVGQQCIRRGEQAAQNLTRRLASRKDLRVIVHLPQLSPGEPDLALDWLDVYNQHPLLKLQNAYRRFMLNLAVPK